MIRFHSEMHENLQYARMITDTHLRFSVSKLTRVYLMLYLMFLRPQLQKHELYSGRHLIF